jgi:hypothetical protein
MKIQDRYKVKEELPCYEYDNELNTWLILDSLTGFVLHNEWFSTEKRANDYLENYLNEITK